jgi:glycosyltransferase involved in cell wall biosynthesis
MKISVIIGSYRPGKCLFRCIESLKKQTVLPDEIIVGVDSISDEQFRWFVHGAIANKIVASGKTGVSAARNAACEVAKGDIFAFIDDDATADPDWVERLHKIFEDPTVSCVGGTVVPFFQDQTLPEKWYWIIGCTGLSKRPICSNMAIRRYDFVLAGRFPENLGRIKHNLTIGEETELILALEKAHRKVLWAPGLVVHHWCPDTRMEWSYILSRAYKEGMGKAIIGKKYALHQEQEFLKYYLTHPDRYTIPILVATGVGFADGCIKRTLNPEL